MSKYIKCTSINSDPIYINTEKIDSFYPAETEENYYSCISLGYSDILVKETLEEIEKLILGCRN